MKYFWYYSPDTTPRPVASPEDFAASDRLSVSCWRPGQTAHHQRALMQQWCEMLPRLRGVRLLWLTFKVPQQLFDAACRMPDLEGLWIKWSSIESIDNLRASEQLKYFHLGSSTKLASIEPLRDCMQLRSLGLENLARIDRLDPIAALTGLDQLSLEGSMWTSWKVATLEPIGRLNGLRYLSLANLRTGDRSLKPLYALRNLETLITARWWDEHELAEIRRSNPRLTDD